MRLWALQGGDRLTLITDPFAAAAHDLDVEREQAQDWTAWRCHDPTCDGQPHEGYEYKHARGKQVLRGFLPDGGDAGRFRKAYIRGGRRSGKTWAAANHLAELIKNNPGKEWACVGPTFGDARDICMENVHSGLIVVLGGRMGGEGRLIESGPYIESWARTYGQLRLTNGGVVYCDGADDGAYRIQGHGLSGCWGDEVGLWVKWKVAFDESIKYAVSNYPAKLILTGTPKRTLGARVLVKRLIEDPDVLNVQLYTEENVHNLDPAAAAEFLSSKGTALERQELYGDLLDEVEGALWKILTWDQTRVEIPAFDAESDPFGVNAIYDLIQPTRVCIAVDPAVTGTDDADEHGIIVCAKGQDGDIYILEDLSFRGAVTAWPSRVIEAAERWETDRVIAEINNGGDYIEQTLRAAGYRGGYEIVRATRGKMIRAEPVATYHERGHVHAVGYFSDLQAECCTWVPGEEMDSPNRLDAMVYAAAWLRPELIQGWASVYTPFSDEEKAEQRTSRAGWANVYAKEQPQGESPEPQTAPVKPRGGYFDF